MTGASGLTPLEAWAKEGFPVVPVAPPNADGIPEDRRGKVPALVNGDGRWHLFKGWRDGQLPPTDLLKYGRAGANVGVPTDEFPAIDIDVHDDEEIAAAIEATALGFLGPAPVRYRENSSSRAILTHLSGAPFKKRALSFTTPGGAQAKVEILAEGQQLVVAPTHASGTAIKWRPELPTPDALPSLDEHGARALLTEIERRLTALNCAGFRCAPTDAPGSVAAPGKVTPEEIERTRSALLVLPPDDYEMWIRVGMALKADLGDAGLRLFAEWSARGAKFKDGEPEKKWASFKGSGVTLGTIYYHATQAGWKDPGPSAGDGHEIKATVPNVRRFVREAASRDGLPTLRFWRGAFYGWSGTAWRELARQDLDKLIIDWFEKHDALDKITKPLLDSFARLLESQVGLAQEDEDGAWIGKGEPPAPAAELVAVRNGLLHVATRKLHPHTPALFNLTARPFDYDPEATCPIWQECLDSWFERDRESERALQEWMGYTVAGDLSQEKALMVLGPARSGKGVIADVLTALVGVEYTASPDLQGLGKDFGLQTLIGKRLATLRDARKGKFDDAGKAAENLLKISAGDRMSVQRKSKTDWTGVLRCAVWIFSNVTPKFADASAVIVSRFIVLRMTETFLGKEDVTLKSRVVKELPGIFLWALAGYDRLQKRGNFVQPKSGEQDVDLLTSGATAVHEFFDDIGASFAEGRCFERDILYSMWDRHCIRNGHERGSKTTFVQAVISYANGRGTSLVIGRPGRRTGDRPYVFKGLAIDLACAKAWLPTGLLCCTFVDNRLQAEVERLRKAEAAGRGVAS